MGTSPSLEVKDHGPTESKPLRFYLENDMSFFDKLNKEGLPFPMVRDPKIGLGSITATLVIVSSFLCIATISLAALSGIARVTSLFVNFAEAQQSLINAFNIAFQFFIACGSFYLGRKFQRNEKGALDVSGEDKSSDEAK